MGVDGRYVFDVETLGEERAWTLANRRVFSHCDKGFPDGIKCDTLGNVYSGCGDGVHVLSPRFNPFYPISKKFILLKSQIRSTLPLFLRCAN